VVEVQVLHRELRLLGHRHVDFDVHVVSRFVGFVDRGSAQCFCLKAKRARMFRSSTPIVMMNTAAQASFCQFWYGLMAKSKITFGRLAIGPDRLVDQK